jgi:hypothetical protein
MWPPFPTKSTIRSVVFALLQVIDRQFGDLVPPEATRQ